MGGEAPAAITGRSLTEFLEKDDLTALQDRLEQLSEGDTPPRGVAIEVTDQHGQSQAVVTISSRIEWEGAERTHTLFLDLATAKTPTQPVESSMSPAADSAPIGVSLLDAEAPEYPFIQVNEALVELTGYPQETLLGHGIRLLSGEQTDEEQLAILEDALAAHQPTTVELRQYRSDETLFWSRVRITPVRDTTGSVAHFLCFHEDISNTKIVNRERTLFEAHAEASDRAVVVTDRDGVIEYVNPAFERITGYTATEAIGQTPNLLYSGEQDDSFYTELWETITSGETWTAEITNRTKSGALFRTSQRIIPITDPDGEVTHFVAVQPDITDQQLTKQATAVLNRILRHNVRTAINIIDGYAELLQSGIEGDERQAALRTIRERTAALEEITTEAENLRALLKRRHSAPMSMIDLTEVVDGYRETYSEAQIDLTVDIGPERAICNGGVFRMALDELVENAVTHADAQQPHIDITVTNSEPKHNVTIIVADDGPPIPQQEWEIIEMGMEAPLEHTSSIGLWLIYWAITALGGKVTLETDDGNRFTTQVPATVK